MDPILERYQALEDKVASYTPTLDAKRLFDAFTYADTEHHGQLRKSGEPYIIHPLAVADIVADLGLDVDSVMPNVRDWIWIFLLDLWGMYVIIRFCKLCILRLMLWLFLH